MTSPERKRTLAGHIIGGHAASGTFSVDFTVHGADGVPSQMLTGLVDTRRLYSIVPAQILAKLGIRREHYRQFRREDGFVRQLGVGLVKMELQGKIAFTAHIVFGDDLHETIIGSMTLAAFALAADPEQRQLVPGLLTL